MTAPEKLAPVAEEEFSPIDLGRGYVDFTPGCGDQTVIARHSLRDSDFLWKRFYAVSPTEDEDRGFSVVQKMEPKI